MAAGTSLVEEVYGWIRAELLTGRLEPGTRLRLRDFAARRGVSQSVVREAVTRLAEQGLVQSSPQRGFRVTPLSIDDLIDLTRTRVLIETLALRESITHGDLNWESTVIARHHALQKTPMTTTDGHVSQTWASAHRLFHLSLLSGCSSTRLESIATGLRDCSDLYQHWSRELAHDTDRDVASEHRDIAELTAARDADAACAALGKHIERTTAALLTFAETSNADRAGISA
jgi:DNA-binding GntR family transcriptional regulator